MGQQGLTSPGASGLGKVRAPTSAGAPSSYFSWISCKEVLFF